MHRRTFLARISALPAGVAAGLTSLPLSGCGGVAYIVPRLSADRLEVDLALLPADGDALLKTPTMERAVYLRRSGDRLTAVLARCTHRGCQPEPEGDRLVCPCHGSEFSSTGTVLQGPAERPLVRYQVTVEGEAVVVWLNRRIEP